MKKILKDPFLPLILLLIFHGIGVAGLLSPWRDQFVLLTPFHLFFSTLFVLRQEPESEHDIFTTLTYIGIAGWGVEVVGVFTGWLFGEYHYGKAFGPIFLGAPPMIGLNWALLTYASVQLSSYLTRNMVAGVILSALIMILLDLLIEPIAPAMDFWYFKNKVAGVHNYVGWGLVALVFSFAFYWRNKPIKRNILGPIFILIQFLFFGSLNLIL